MINSAKKGVLETLQVAGTTTGSGTALAIPSDFVNHKVRIIGSSGINAGAIQVESADNAAYAGTWAAIGSPLVAVASSEVEYNFTGLFNALRARVSTTITGGSITVQYCGS